MNAEIITIGDEILIGQIVDTNSAWIAQELSNLGISILKMSSISDRRESIINALDNRMPAANVLLITGGLGPTKDDITKTTISEYFDSPLIRDAQVLQHVQRFFSSRDLPMLEINEQQADVLADAEVLFNDYGTAPGMWIEKQGTIFVFMPGVPFEMKHLLQQRVLPKLLHLNSSPILYFRTLLLGGIGESYLANLIADIENELPPSIQLAYLPNLASIRLRLSATGKDLSALGQQTDGFVDRICERAKDYVIAREDISLEKYIIQHFTADKLLITTAESCTGGTLAAALTSIPGSSAVFVGGTVPYSNRLKQQLLAVRPETLEKFDAVSEQTVVEMAQAAQKIFAADYAIATSGLAGPDGGTAEIPVGTIWIAVAGKTKTLRKKFLFQNSRLVNIERARQQALLLLWNLYKEEKSIPAK